MYIYERKSMSTTSRIHKIFISIFETTRLTCTFLIWMLQMCSCTFSWIVEPPTFVSMLEVSVLGTLTLCPKSSHTQGKIHYLYILFLLTIEGRWVLHSDVNPGLKFTFGKSKHLIQQYFPLWTRWDFKMMGNEPRLWHAFDG